MPYFRLQLVFSVIYEHYCHIWTDREDSYSVRKTKASPKLDQIRILVACQAFVMELFGKSS